MPKTVTRKTIIDFIEANRDKQNYLSTYAKDDGTPSCVIGHVLFDAGYDLKTVKAGLAFRAFFDLDITCSMSNDPLGIFATRIQQMADRNYTWGRALDYALEQERTGERWWQEWL